MFKTKEFMGKRVLSSSFIEGDSSICAFFTTRDLPLKYGERDDLISLIGENKKLVAEGFEIPAQNVIIPVQTHSDNVEIIRRNKDKSLEKSVFPNCDGLITAEKGIAIALNFADCVPLIFYDSVKKVIASSHAGWRGTVAKIGVKTVLMMQENFGCQPKDIVALIGPAISRCCFEVKADVKAKLLHTVKDSEQASVCDKMNVDLKLINKLQLHACGVEKIDTSDYCTSCRSDLFYSYRKEKGHTARHSAVIVLK
jgi:YfiH family protein